MDQVLEKAGFETIRPEPGQTQPPPRRLVLSPLNRRRLENFKANRRGYWSLWIFLVLFIGSLLIETIFSLDGLGLLGFESVLNRDYPVVFATLYIFSLMGLVINLVSDLTYTWIDPRIDFETREV